MNGLNKPRSLSLTLFIRVLLLLGGTILAIGTATFYIVKARVDENYDAELVVATQILRTLSEEELEADTSTSASSDVGALAASNIVLSSEDRKAFETYAKWRRFQIWQHGVLTAASANGHVNSRLPTAIGFADLLMDGSKWRVFRFYNKSDDTWLVVGEPMNARYAFMRQISFALAIPLMALIPASAGLIWITLLDGLGALKRLGDALSLRSGSNLSRLDLSKWPSDLLGILTSINSLLDRLERSFRQTQRFTDHAAHQLRTPLAGLKLSLQVIETETDPTERTRLTTRMGESVERNAALLEQLLTLARLDSGDFSSASSDLESTIRSVLQELAPNAALKGVSLAMHASAGTIVRGDPVLLKLIVSNLADNAIKYSPSGAEVLVAVSVSNHDKTQSSVTMKVVDQGPGIPEELRDRVFERFYQLNSNKPGVGLGLSIVAEAISHVGGTITLETSSSGHGLCAVCRFRSGAAPSLATINALT